PTRDRPSVPTRRSSDLRGRRARAAAGDGIRCRIRRGNGPARGYGGRGGARGPACLPHGASDWDERGGRAAPVVWPRPNPDVSPSGGAEGRTEGRTRVLA